VSGAWSAGWGTSQRRQTPNSRSLLSTPPKPQGGIQFFELTITYNVNKSTSASRPLGSEPALRWDLHLVSLTAFVPLALGPEPEDILLRVYDTILLFHDCVTPALHCEIFMFLIILSE